MNLPGVLFLSAYTNRSDAYTAALKAAGLVPENWVDFQPPIGQEEARLLKEIKPEIVIYSGYPAEIVPAEILELGFPFLHFHSGWLPDYRGSTTIYYSILLEGRCAVTALILDEGIDTGPIVMRRHYPAPPHGTDMDEYDNKIRSDLLVRVMRQYAKTGKLPHARPQRGVKPPYFVIHPILKHLALLRAA